jgi:hypothetical protein
MKANASVAAEISQSPSPISLAGRLRLAITSLAQSGGISYAESMVKAQ